MHQLKPNARNKSCIYNRDQRWQFLYNHMLSVYNLLVKTKNEILLFSYLEIATNEHLRIKNFFLKKLEK